MENEIPAGTKVKVNGQAGEVLAHMDGVVHVDINGEAVSVDPSQVVVVGESGAPAQESATVTENVSASAIDKLNARIAELEAQFKDGWTAVCAVESRVTALEAAAKIIYAATPAAQSSTTDDKGTASAASAEPTGDGQSTNGPEATAGTTGQ